MIPFGLTAENNEQHCKLGFCEAKKKTCLCFPCTVGHNLFLATT